jgi:SAM-dependent methyltransferase
VYRNTSDSDHHYDLLKSYFYNDALRRKGFYRPKGKKEVLPQIRKRAMWEIYTSCLDDLVVNNADIDDVVDLGCGMGHFVLELDQRHSFQRIVGLDFLRDTFQVALENNGLFAGVSFVEGDLVQIPFRKRSFDVSFCLNVLHHIHGEDVAQVINEIKRITKKFIVIEIRNNAYLFNFWYKYVVHRHYKELPMGALSIGDMTKFMNTFTCIRIVGKRRFHRLCRRLVLIYQRNDGEEE